MDIPVTSADRTHARRLRVPTLRRRPILWRLAVSKVSLQHSKSYDAPARRRLEQGARTGGGWQGLESHKPPVLENQRSRFTCVTRLTVGDPCTR